MIFWGNDDEECVGKATFYATGTTSGFLRINDHFLIINWTEDYKYQ